MKFIAPEAALQVIKSNNRIFVHGSAATPHTLLRALEGRMGELSGLEMVNISLLGNTGLTDKKYDANIFFNSLFVSSPVRKLVNCGNGSYIPVFLSEIYKLFENGYLPVDVALIHVSPPDRHGYCSLGVSVDIARAAVKASSFVIAQVNSKMPRTHGDALIHVNEINAFVETDDDLPEVYYHSKITEDELLIGKYCAELIEDRSTLQMGIGCIPDSVLACLGNHNDLGIHTEMLSDGIIDLIEKGVITNRYKKKHKGKIATSFAAGTRRLYDFIDDNPLFSFLEASYINDDKIIRSNPKAIAINSAIEIDLTGQVCSDSIGTFQFSGVGGQMDFIRGAALSEGGKAIIAMHSQTSNGQSKIVPFLKEGAGVVTTRAHVHYVVTEYGVVNLFGKNLRQRAVALCSIAHPDHREWLQKEIHKRFNKF